MFAAHHRLGNLTAILDLNGQQALGYTRDVIDLEPRRRALAAVRLGCPRGRRPRPAGAERRARSAAATTQARPHVVLAQTTFGKGVSFMESKIEWHYLPMSEEHYAQAIEELALSRPRRSRMRAEFAAELVAVAREDERVVAADRRPRLRRSRAVRRGVPRPLLQRRRRRAEHARDRDRAGRRRLRPVRLLDRDVRLDAPIRIPPQRRRAARAAGAARRHGRRLRLRSQRRDPLRTRGRRNHARAAGLSARSPRPTPIRRATALHATLELPGPGYIRALQEGHARARPRRALRAGRAELLGGGEDVALIALGDMAGRGCRRRRSSRAKASRRPSLSCPASTPRPIDDSPSCSTRCRWRLRSRRTT